MPGTNWSGGFELEDEGADPAEDSETGAPSTGGLRESASPSHKSMKAPRAVEARLHYPDCGAGH